MKVNLSSLLVVLSLGIASLNAEVDCSLLSQTVTITVSADKSNVLEIVSREVAAAPSCSCEIVKAAITASKATSEKVGAIVEAAITAAPEQSSLISQCAIATAPDAASAVQKVLAKLDPNSGDSAMRSRDSKAAIEEAPAPSGFNPLDVPGEFSNSVPNPGGQIIDPGARLPGINNIDDDFIIVAPVTPVNP